MNTPEQFRHPIENELNRTRALLQKVIQDSSNDVQPFTSELIDTFSDLWYAGLLLHTACANSKITDNHIKAATAIELIALGINMEEAEEDYTFSHAVNTLLICKGLQLLVGINDSDLLTHTTLALELAAEGHIVHRQTNCPTLQEYEVIIQRETAALFGLAVSTGAHLSGISRSDVTVWEEIGANIGCAVHIMQDVCSFRNREENPLAASTFPMIYYFNSLDVESQKNLRQKIASSSHHNANIYRAVCNPQIVGEIKEKTTYFSETALILLRKVCPQKAHAPFSLFLEAVEKEIYF